MRLIKLLPITLILTAQTVGYSAKSQEIHGINSVRAAPLEIYVQSRTNAGWPIHMYLEQFDFKRTSDTQGYSPALPPEHLTGSKGVYVREQIANVVWDFGDGSGPISRQDRAAASHVYRKTGDYTIKVTLLDEEGLPFKRATKKITVKSVEPLITYSAVAANADKPSELTFSASTFGRDLAVYDEPLKFQWDFGDGKSRQGEDLFQVAHNYQNTGTYQTSLTVTTQLGDTETRKKKIKVVAKNDRNNATTNVEQNTDRLTPPDVIANKVNLQVKGDVNGNIEATAIRISGSTFLAPVKGGVCRLWMNFWSDSQLFWGSLMVDLGKLPKLKDGHEVHNFSASGKQRLGMYFYSSGQQKQYLFRKRGTGAFGPSDPGKSMHGYDLNSGFGMRSGNIKLSYKKGAYLIGNFNSNLQAKLRPDDEQYLTINAKGDFALDLGSRGSIMDSIAKGWECLEHGFEETERIPENGVQHEGTRPIISIKFSEDLQLDSINNDSFKVGYPNAQGEFVPVSGRFVNDRSKIQFVPHEPLRKGVRYTVKLKVGEQGVRSASGDFIPDEGGTGWQDSEFWTRLPFSAQAGTSGGLSCDIYQTVKNAPLILGKPALMKIYADWPVMDDVHKSAQYRNFEATKISYDGAEAKPIAHQFTRPDLMRHWGVSALREKEAAQSPFTLDVLYSHLLVSLEVETNSSKNPKNNYLFYCPVRPWDKAPELTADVYVVSPEDGNYGDKSETKEQSFEPIPQGQLDALLDRYLKDVRTFSKQLFPIKDIQFSIKKFVELPSSGFDRTKPALEKLIGEQSNADIVVVVVPHEINGGGGNMQARLIDGQGWVSSGLSDASTNYSRYVFGLTHEIGHVFIGSGHLPTVEDAATQEAYLAKVGKVDYKFDAIDGIKLSEDGTLWWHKSSRLGNEESSNLVPLMLTGTMNVEDTFIGRYDYRKIQVLFDILEK